MKKVLLAISGVSPRLRAFQYSAELCARIKADLNILQIIGLTMPQNGLKRLHDKAGKLRYRLEDSMTAAAFAEAGEHETANEILAQARRNLEPLLSRAEKAGLNYQVTVKAGDPGREIAQYLKGHRNIVLTVYDVHKERDSSAGRKRSSVPTEITEQSPVPVILVR